MSRNQSEMASTDDPPMNDEPAEDFVDDMSESSGDEDDTPASKSQKRERSWVWGHFTKQTENPNKCNCHYCKKEMACSSKSGTTTLSKHLRKTCKAFKAYASARGDKGDQTVLTPDGVGGNLKVSRVSEAVHREAVNEMIVIGELPLSFVESLAFRHYCSKTQQYQPHSRRTATRDIYQMYVDKKANMRQILEKTKQRLSLTTDIWVAPNTGASYMVITAHFVDALWKLKKMIIGFKPVEDHRGKTIAKVLFDCLAVWNIKRVFCITVDNATANSTAMRIFKESMKKVVDDSLVLKGAYLHLRCATHILNLIVKEGLQEIEYSVSTVRNAIQYVRSSPNRMKAFDFRVESRKIKRGSLPLDVKTRWNSTYLMLGQALKFREAFEMMEAEDRPYYDYFQEKIDGKKRAGPPVSEDWDEVDRLVQLLTIFYNSTLVLSASTSVASHKIYNEIVTITKTIKTLRDSVEVEEGMKKKAASMLTKLDKYWNPFGDEVEMNKLVMVDVVFDPRKKMGYVKACCDRLYGPNSVEATHLYDSVNMILNDMYDEYSSSVIRSSSGGSGSSSQSSQSQSQSQGQQSQDQAGVGSGFNERTMVGNRIVIETMDSEWDGIVMETGIGNSGNELEIYLKEKVEKPNLIRGSEYDLLSWWKVNSGKFLVLSLIAKDILAMQVSSVASESAFSTSGRILEPSRSCLTDYSIEVLMCIEQWLKCEVTINDKGVSTITQMLADIELQDDLMREFDPEFNTKD